MAMEYIYVCQRTEQPVALCNFKGLQYNCDCLILEIANSQGKREASFCVEKYNCYMLERRNQSALQLHKVTPPRFCMDTLLWLFGFGRKQHCDSLDSFTQICKDYREAHPNLQIETKEINSNGTHVKYAFVNDRYISPIAYYYKQAEGTAWSLWGKETSYEIVAEMHSALGKFKYPLQYVIHTFKGSTMSYPVETRKFFRSSLGYWDEAVYYADEPDCGF